MEKLNFQHPYSSPQSHDPPEIILIWWFGALERFLIIVINIENLTFLWKPLPLFSRLFDK